MSTALNCVVVALGLILVTRAMLLFEQKKLGAIDNMRPRRQWRQLKDRGARVLEAHTDALEAFAPFAAAVIIAHLVGANEKRTDMLAIAWVIARVVHPAAHIAQADYLRAGLGVMSWLCVVGMFALAVVT